MVYDTIIILLIVFSATYLFSLKRDIFVNPAFYVIIFQIINFTGTLPLLDLSMNNDLAYFFIFVVGILATLFGFIIGDILFPVKIGTIKNWKNKLMIIEKGIVYNGLIYSLVIISIIISVLYYYSVGYNVFLLGIMNMLSGGGVVEDVSNLRLASYNSAVTGNYYYPGYVNQFKDTLLPLSLIYLWAKQSISPKVLYKKTTKTILIIFTVLSIIFILGTGQRGAFVLIMLITGAFLMTVANRKNKRKILLLGSVFVLTFLMLSTFLIGRTGAKEFELGATLEAIWWRIASANQWGATVGFREIIYKEPTQWGADWLKSIAGLLPGVKGSMLSNKIARIMWGGYGTAPPSNWGSIFYNFGWYGIVVVPLIFSLMLKYFYYRFYLKEKHLFRILIYIGSFVLMGTWIAGGPVDYLFNVGLIAIIILKILFGFMEKVFGKKYFFVYKN